MPSSFKDLVAAAEKLKDILIDRAHGGIDSVNFDPSRSRPLCTALSPVDHEHGRRDTPASTPPFGKGQDASPLNRVA